MNRWKRLLVTGLVASVLLHLLMLDFLRTYGRPEIAAALPLKADLRLPTSPVQQAPAPAAQTANQHAAVNPAVVEANQVFKNDNGARREVPLDKASPAYIAMPNEAPSPQMESRGDASSIAEKRSFGFRPLSLDEAEAAYRMELASAVRSNEFRALQGKGAWRCVVRLQLRLDGVESLSVVESSDMPELDLAALQALSQAAARARLPEELSGLSAAIDLELVSVP